METLILFVHILAALCMIGLILLQQGKGAEAGASFGAGASNTFFGASGTGNFLTKSTAVLTAIFFGTSIMLAIFAKRHSQELFTLPGTSTSVTAPNAASAPVTSAPASAAPAVPAPATAPTTPVAAS